MKIAFSILDAVLIFLSFGAIGSQLDPSMPKLVEGEYERYLSTALFFSGFMYLHWSFWRLLVPRGITEHSCARFAWGKPRTGFFRGTIGFGYLCVGAYCFERAQFAIGDWRSSHQFPFWMGLILILIGTVVRSREVMLHLASGRAWEATKQDSNAKAVVSADAPTLHANS